MCSLHRKLAKRVTLYPGENTDICLSFIEIASVILCPVAEKAYHKSFNKKTTTKEGGREDRVDGH